VTHYFIYFYCSKNEHEDTAEVKIHFIFVYVLRRHLILVPVSRTEMLYIR
jgi:hypothetical protein